MKRDGIIMSNLFIPDSFLKKERRRSFVVSEVMKRSWAADLKILKEIEEFCDMHSLKLFACYGTLLGAVRDHGFIAWDDDVDMGLVGEDYISFLDIFSKEYGDKYNILNPYTRTWHHMNFTHIANGSEMNFSRKYLNEWYGCPFMAGPDIYPYYYIPRNPDEEKYILHLLERIDYTIALSKQSQELAGQKGNLKSNDEIIKALTLNLYELQKETGFEFSNDRPLDNQLEILYDQVCRLTEESDADYICRYDEYMKNKNKKFPKEHFATTIPVKFENTTIPVPIGYDEVLRRRFGENYIIPRREAAAHDYPFFKKQLDENIYLGNTSLKDLFNCSTLDKSLFERKENEKVILYHTSVRFMLIYSEFVMDKIKNVLNFAQKNKDIVKIVWLPDGFSKTDDVALDLMAPNLIEEYEKLIKDYVSDGGMIICREDVNSELIDKFDLYFGDEDDIAKEFVMSNKKITIQEYSNSELEIKDSLEINELGAEKETSCISTKEKSSKEVWIIPDEWKKILLKADGAHKKSVLYFLSVSKIYQNEENALNKIEKALEIFKDNKDEISLLWYIMPITLDLYDVLDSEFLNNLDNVIDRFKDEGWGIYVEDEQLNDAIEISDAFYGDPDAVTLRMKDMQKPVMLQNYDI